MRKFFTVWLSVLIFVGAAFCAADFSRLGAPSPSKEEAAAILEAEGLLAKDLPGAVKILEQASEKKWAGAALYFNLANLYYRNGNLKGAEKFFGKAVEKSGQFFQARKNLGICLLEMGRHGQARKELGGALALCGGADTQILMLMSAIDARGGDFHSALSCCNQALLYEPENVEMLEAKLGYLSELGKWDDCGHLAKKLVRKGSLAPGVWRVMALSHFKQGDETGALADLELARIRGASDAACEKMLADLYLKKHMPDFARAIFENMGDKTERDAALLRCAGEYFRLSDYGAAEQICTRLEASKFSDAARLKAACMSMDGRGGDAEKYLRAARTKFPEDARLTLDLARICSAQKNYIEAERLFEECCEDESLREAAMYGLLGVAAARADLDSALKVASRLEKLYPSDEISDYVKYLKSIEKNVEKSPR